MLGAILGDIIGSRLEFKKERLLKVENFKLFDGSKNYYTDDTVMTIATADAIMNNKDLVSTYHYWGNKYPNCGYGGSFKSWLNNKDTKPYNSYGNGSAMRVSSVGWLFNNTRDVIINARKTANVTHNHIQGVIGAESVALCIFMARNKTTKNDIKDAVEYYFGYNLNRTIEEIRPTYKFDVTCQGSVPESIICFLEGNNYEDVVRKAVSLGGDTDTQGCIAGSIAEAYYGIPNNLIAKIDEYLPDDMLDIIEQFNNVKYKI